MSNQLSRQQRRKAEREAVKQARGNDNQAVAQVPAGMKVKGIITGKQMKDLIKQGQMDILVDAERAKDYELNAEQLLLFADLAISLTDGAAKKKLATLLAPPLELLTKSDPPIPSLGNLIPKAKTRLEALNRALANKRNDEFLQRVGDERGPLWFSVLDAIEASKRGADKQPHTTLIRNIAADYVLNGFTLTEATRLTRDKLYALPDTTPGKRKAIVMIEKHGDFWTKPESIAAKANLESAATYIKNLL